jgi:hypothetical protein
MHSSRPLLKQRNLVLDLPTKLGARLVRAAAAFGLGVRQRMDPCLRPTQLTGPMPRDDMPDDQIPRVLLTTRKIRGTFVINPAATPGARQTLPLPIHPYLLPRIGNQSRIRAGSPPVRPWHDRKSKGLVEPLTLSQNAVSGNESKRR